MTFSFDYSWMGLFISSYGSSVPNVGHAMSTCRGLYFFTFHNLGSVHPNAFSFQNAYTNTLSIDFKTLLKTDQNENACISN